MKIKNNKTHKKLYYKQKNDKILPKYTIEKVRKMNLNEETSLINSDDSLLVKWLGRGLIAFIVTAPALTMFKILVFDKYIMHYIAHLKLFLV